MKILVVAGSSGGHIFPALALLEYLKQNYAYVDTQLVLPIKNIKRNIEVSGFNPDFALGFEENGLNPCQDKACEQKNRRRIQCNTPRTLLRAERSHDKKLETFYRNPNANSGFKVVYVDSVSLGLKIDFRNLLAVFKFFKSVWQSLIIFLRFQPDVVVGFGSIDSIPLVIFGKLSRLKVVLHEQNVIPGKANCFLLRFCDWTAISFDQTREYLKNCSNKIIFTGNPLRASLARLDKRKCWEFFALDENKFTILVMGGSQGSLRINNSFLNALASLPGRQNLQVIHLAGFFEEAKLNQEYFGIEVKARVFSFLNKMEYALSLADLAVCRAGATSIQELIHYQLPAVLLPYPFAYQHQMANAKVLSDLGAAIILEDKELSSDKLRNILEKILSNQQNLEKMRSGYNCLKTGNAAKQLAELVMGSAFKER